MGKSNGRQSIFITGAASGMGRETARLFAAQGWFVVSAVPLAPLLERSERRCLKPLRAWTHDDFRAYA